MRDITGSGVSELEIGVSATITPGTADGRLTPDSLIINSTWNPVIEGGIRPPSIIADLFNNGLSPTTAAQVINIDAIGNSGTTTASIAFTLATSATNPWKIAFTEGTTKTLEFTITQPSIPWLTWNSTGNISVVNAREFNLVKLYIFGDTRTSTLPPGGITLAGKSASLEESSVIAINVENKYTGIYPLPKAIPVTYMSTSSANTSYVTKELQFNLGASLYNDASGVANTPSYVNIFLVSSYVSPNSTVSNVQLIQRSRQVWLNG